MKQTPDKNPAADTTTPAGPLTPATPRVVPDALNMMGDRNGPRPAGGQELTDDQLVTDHGSLITPPPPGIYDGGAEHVGNPYYLVDPVTGKSQWAIDEQAKRDKANAETNAREAVLNQRYEAMKAHPVTGPLFARLVGEVRGLKITAENLNLDGNTRGVSEQAAKLLEELLPLFADLPGVQPQA